MNMFHGKVLSLSLGRSLGHRGMQSILVIMTCVIGISLAYFRAPMPDEKEYILETALMYDQMIRGEWFGNDWVGTHGFVFKFLGVLLWLVFGKSVFVLTLLHVILAGIAVFLLFHFASFWLKDPLQSFCVCVLFISGYYFQISLPSYLREIPALFSILLLFCVMVKTQNYFIWSACLLLLLEAKEHVFFQILPGMMLGILLQSYASCGRRLNDFFRDTVLKMLRLLSLPALWVFIMLCTSLVPPNLYVIALLGMRDSDNSYYVDFKPEMATVNTAVEGRQIAQIDIESAQQKILVKVNSENASYVSMCFVQFVAWFLSTVNIILMYLGKFAYPRTFSFVSVPLFIVLPVLVYAIQKSRHCWIQKKHEEQIFCLMFFSFFLTYFLRLSHGRYLLVISPLIYMYFVEVLFQKRTGKWVWITAFLLSLLSYYFETSMALFKLTLSGVIIAVLFGMHHFALSSQVFRKLCVVFCLGFSVLALLISLKASSTLEDGQLHQFKKWGYNYEVEEIMASFDAGKPFWINSYLPVELAMKNPYKLNQLKKEYGIRPYVPKSQLMKQYDILGDSCQHGFSWENTSEFHGQLKRYGIERFGLLVSALSSDVFYNQSRLDDVIQDKRFELIRTRHLKNKTLYVFHVV